MTTATHEDLLDWLTVNGWRQQTDGQMGAVWVLGDTHQVGILHGLNEESFEWRQTLERVATAHGYSVQTLVRYFESLWTDEIEFAAGGARSDALPIRDAERLMSVTMTAVRTTATTAFLPKFSIRGNYLARSDRLVDRVEFAHTRPGSFVMPVRYKLVRSALKETEGALQASFHPEFIRTENLETEERRASRTLMQAMWMIEAAIIQPHRAPTPDTLQEIYRLGVSSELLKVVGDFLRAPEEANALRVEAAWAGKPKPPDMARRVEVEASADAAHLLDSVADAMRRQRKIEGESISGPVVGVRLISPVGKDGLAPAIATIQGSRRGRASLIEVDVPRDQFNHITEWLRSGELVQGFGTIGKRGGRLHLNIQGSLRGLRNPGLPIGD